MHCPRPVPQHQGLQKDDSPVPDGTGSGRGGGTCANPASVWAAPPAWAFPHGPLIRLPVSWPSVSAPGQPARLSPRRKGRKHSCEAWPPNPGSSLCFCSALCPQPRGTLLTPHPRYLRAAHRSVQSISQVTSRGSLWRGPQCLVSAQGRSWSTKSGPREQACAGPAWGGEGE